VSRPVWNAIVQWPRLIILPQLPGMQVMHALVGCQKRWINSRKRSFHSADMTYFRLMPFNGRSTIGIAGAASSLLNSLPPLSWMR